jgi:heme oxygenase
MVMPGRQPLRALKLQTQDLHAEAERYVRILDDDAGVADYARYLIAMRGFHAPVEDMFAADRALAAAGFAADERRKTGLLIRDLRALAAVVDLPDQGSVCGGATVCCDDMPEIDSFAARLGMAYVIEGSTLGGKFILARLPAQLAVWRGVATAFLDGYGAATGARWRGFGAIVERAVTTDDAEAQLVAGARQTFASLIRWLARFERRAASTALEARAS